MNSEPAFNENVGLQFSLRSLIAVILIVTLSMAICLPLIRPSSPEFDPDYGSFFLLSAFLAGLGLSAWFRDWLIFSCLVAIGLVVSFSLMPAVGSHSPSKRAMCQNNLKQLALACHNYEAAFKTFPATARIDKDPQFPYSWRVAILPYVEQQALYDQYRFDEPWDGPNNSRLAAGMPKVFQCPTHRNKWDDFTTPYVALTGPGTMFPEDRPGKIKTDASLGLSNMIAIIECPDHAVHWMKPDDLTLDEAIALFSPTATTPPKENHRGGGNAARCDGSTEFLSFGDGEFIGILRAMKDAAGTKNNPESANERPGLPDKGKTK